jgi:hypothetical protein
VKEVTWTFDARRALRKLPPEVRADIEAKLGGSQKPAQETSNA